jgi:hypothetical protein
MSGFKVVPKKPAVDPAALAEFASGADKIQGAMPWEGLDDKRRMAAFSLRLTACELAKLKHIASTTPDSMHEFCIRAVKKALDEKLV